MSKIMIIDDVKENLSLLDRTLSVYSYDIRVFNNPLLALKNIEEIMPDLILLDINMPQMNGYEVCETIKTKEKLRDVPIIFLTAQDDTESKVKAFKNGGVDYITKPFIIEELCARVETQLKISSIQKELKNTNTVLEERVKARTQKLFEELQERKVLEKKLRIAVEEAQIANRAKSAFLSNMSHELRTPMNAICGMTELLKMEEVSEEQKKYLLYQTEAELNLLKIINDILDMEKMEKGTIDLKEECIDLKGILGREFINYERKAKNKGLIIEQNVEVGIPDRLFGDREKIERILENIVNNAIKFTEKGNIKINITKKQEENFTEVIFSVSDTGKGIEVGEAERIFKPFEQGDSSYTKKYQGIGMGLIIAKRFIKAMDGDIRFTSELGKGTTFYFNIKLKNELEEARDIHVENKDAVFYKKIINEDKITKSILVAEDNPVNMMLAVEMIKKAGAHTIIRAENGKEAVEKYKLLKPDIVLMDIQMPVMDGIEAYKEIKKIAENEKNKIRVYAISAYATERDKEMFLNIGMNGFISKPYTFEQIKEIM